MFNKLKDYLRRNTKYGRSRYLNYLYRYDMKRFFCHSAMEHRDEEVIAGKIRLLVHALEKGLSAKNQKPEFGKEKVNDLLLLVEQYRNCKNDPDPQALLLADAVIGSWAQNRIARGENVSFLPDKLCAESRLAGVWLHKKSVSSGFAEIAENRHSIRTFSGEPVDAESIRAAVALAQTAPSACNRQATHVFACTNPDIIRTVTENHGGFRGFWNIGAILVVTGNLRLYQNEYERNTVFLDGGIFLMNLLYALEEQGLGSCPIIWGAEPDGDRMMYDLLGIPESHEIVALVACGHYPEEVKVPYSKRRPLETVVHIVD